MPVHFSYKKAVSKDAYFYLVEPDDWRACYQAGGRFLPALSEGEAGALVKRYQDILERWRSVNKDNTLFLSTPFSAGNTWQSSFFQGMESFERLQKLMSSVENSAEVVFIDPSWFLYAQKICEVCEVDSADVRKAKRDSYGLLHHVKMVYRAIRFFLSRTGLFPANKSDDMALQWLCASIWMPRAVAVWNKERRDPFWGNLPQQLAGGGQQAAVIFYLEQSADAAIHNGHPPAAFNMIDCLSFWNVLTSLWGILTFRYKCPEGEYPVSIVHSDIMSGIQAQLPLTLIAYHACRNVLKKNVQANALHLYEGNCWEAGCIAAARDLGRKTIGFQHTAIMPSGLKQDGGSDYKIYPDAVLSSGKNASAILKNIMHHDCVLDGCDLRRQNTEDVRYAESNEGRLLVLLQGSPSDYGVLQVIERYIAPDYGQKIYVRMHPLQPIGQETLSDIFVIDEHKTLTQALLEAEVVLHSGTTAVFEALLSGRPAVYIDTGQAMSSDPLFDMPDNPVTRHWKAGEDFGNILAAVRNLSQDDREQDFQLVRNYIRGYFVPADVNAVDGVIRTLSGYSKNDT